MARTSNMGNLGCKLSALSQTDRGRVHMVRGYVKKGELVRLDFSPFVVLEYAVERVVGLVGKHPEFISYVLLERDSIKRYDFRGN